MRRILAALALLPALSLLVSCGGASKVTSSVASIADPKEALAASSEVMSKESYFLEFDAEFSGDSGGTYEIARKGDRFMTHIDEKQTGEFWMFFLGDRVYWCIAGEKGGLGALFGGGSGGDDGCLDFSAMSGDEDEGSSSGEGGANEEIDSLFFDPLKTLLSEAADEDVTVKDADDRKVAGEDARCFDLVGPDADAVVCVSKESGMLVLIDGEINGADGKLELKSSREPKDKDFDLPYDIVEGNGFSNLVGGGSATYEDPEPKQPDNPGIPAVRIAGKPYPWETGAPLCPAIDIENGVFDFAVVPGGKFVIDETIIDKDCKQTADPDGYATRAYDANGNAYVAQYFDGTVTRVTPDGKRTIIAGKDCGFDCELSKDDKTDGPALEVDIYGVDAIAVTGGTVWFVARAYNEDDKDEMLYKLRRLTADGRVETVPAIRKDDDWIDEILAGPDSSLYVVYWDGKVWRRDADGKVTKVNAEGFSCVAVAKDGTLWGYDWFEHELTAIVPGGARKTFHFEPDAGGAFSCADIAVEENGDLLFLSSSFGDYPGLWRIPNPLAK